MAERERSAAEMKAIKQAMMEELGIARRDALPLEDRAANVPMIPLSSINRPVRPEHPTSAWHNLNLDDVDPGLEDLDDIAGGQLYRLRRGGTGLSNGGRGGHSAGRIRGGASNRGGHASVDGRGNHSARGKNTDNSGSGQTYYNDARRGGKSHAKVDAGIARLQREAEFSRKNRTEGRSFKTPQSTSKSTKPVHRAASPAVARAAPLPNRLVNSRFKLTSPATFLSHNNIGSSPVARAPELLVSAPQNKVDDDLLLPPPASKLAPQGGLASSRWASSSAPLVDTSRSDDLNRSATPANTASASALIPSVQQVVPAITTSASISACSAQQIMPMFGAVTSEPGHYVRSLSPAISTNASELTRSVQPATAAARLTLVTDDVTIQRTPIIVRTVVDERIVKVSKNNSTYEFGIAKLIKLDEKSPLMLEIQIDNDVILSEVLSEATIFRLDKSLVTYRANPTTENIPTWNLQFQLPGPAKGFINYHNFRLSELRRSSGSSHSSEQEKQGPLVLLSPVSSSEELDSFHTKPGNKSSYLTNRISSSTFADLTLLDGEEILVPLHEEECKIEDNQVEEYSHFQDLLSLMEGDIVEGTLQVLNANHGGSFYDHVFHLAKNVGLENDAYFMEHAKNVFIGGLSSSRYSSSKSILSITEGLVSDFLTRSQTLLRFPQEFIDAYIKEIAKKILDMAQNFHNGTQLATAIPAEKSSSVEAVELTEVSEIVGAVKSVEPLQIVEATKPTEVISPIQAASPAAVTENVIFRPKQVAYSIQEMMKMRPNATLTSEVLAAKNSLEKYLPGHRLQYKNSLRATATKLQPSEWKTNFGSKVTSEEFLQTLRQDEHAPGKTSFVASSGAVNPPEFSGVKLETPINVGRSLSSAGDNIENIENDLTLPISDEKNVKKPSVDAHHQDNSDKSIGTYSIASQSATHNSSKSLSAAEGNIVEDKMDFGSGNSPPILPSNRGLSTSRYAGPDVINQEAVLRASSGYNPAARQVVKKQERLPPKPRETSINVESSDFSKNEPIGLAYASETEKSKSQVTNPNTLGKIMDNEMNVSKAVEQRTLRSKHTVTNSDVDRLAQVFSDLDVKPEKDNGTVVDVSPVPERSTSPTVEELLQKKRASGLSTSRWASQGTTLKRSSRTEQSTPTMSYGQSTSNMPQDNRLFYSQSAVAVTPSRPFPSRSNMLNGRPADTDGDDVMKATAPVFTPSPQKNESTVNRSVLYPVRNHQNPQQEAVQARLNKSLVSKRM
ncbi:hypothetical protein BCIN_04g04370 [Botrytis cinerea B05.10]|uniref:Uncharacterized protein n=1 Tax=Botryotinia fuckeliana (strain B05.10) TaxID=332648 RepID=A0A384JF91_BOTFB|nr:hypothetical protein BCIN_04g04370 [Botrytis cinerea B05.10]ATZ49268.1 hypothetical protein BCIN_04g04370 [Botrytis cinerea B05.10]